MIITLPCLFTKQKTKKKKSWADGLLKVARESGTCRLFEKPGGKRVVSALLDSTTLTREELAVVLKGEEIEIDFESFLVMVDAVEIKGPSSSSSTVETTQRVKTNGASAAKSKAGLIVAPFKPPSKIAHSGANEEEALNTQQNSAIAKFSSKSDKSANFAKRYEGTVTVVVSRDALGGVSGVGGGGANRAIVPGGGKYSVEDDELDEIWGEEEADEIPQGQRTDEGYQKDGFVVDDKGPEEKRRRTAEAHPPSEWAELGLGAENVLNGGSAPAFTAAPQQEEDLWGGVPVTVSSMPEPDKVVPVPAPAPAPVVAKGEEDLWSF